MSVSNIGLAKSQTAHHPSFIGVKVSPLKLTYFTEMEMTNSRYFKIIFNFRIKQQQVGFKFEDYHMVFAGRFPGSDQLKEDRLR